MKSDWLVIGASVTGTSHRKVGLPCQDFWTESACRGDVLVVAVADGAGSASHSALGSRCAASRAVSAVFDCSLQSRTGGVHYMLADAFAQAHEELAMLARAKSLRLRNLATTLTIVIAMPDCLGVAQTGDGLVVALEPDGTLVSCTHPQRGEYANETHFVTGKDGSEPRFLEVFPPALGFAVVTDGLLPVASDVSTGDPHDPFFKPFFDVLQTRHVTAKTKSHLVDFLTSPRVAERVDDDLTLVVARNSDSPCQPNER